MKCGGTKNATGSVSEGGKLSGDELSRMEQDKEVGGGAPPDRWTGGRAVLAVRGRVQGWGTEASLRRRHLCRNLPEVRKAAVLASREEPSREEGLKVQAFKDGSVRCVFQRW